jgi:hypothetical protein
MIDSRFFTGCLTTSGTIQFPSFETKRNIGYHQSLTVQNGPLGYLSVLLLPAAPFPPAPQLWAESRASPLSPILFLISSHVFVISLILLANRELRQKRPPHGLHWVHQQGVMIPTLNLPPEGAELPQLSVTLHSPLIRTEGVMCMQHDSKCLTVGQTS